MAKSAKQKLYESARKQGLDQLETTQKAVEKKVQKLARLADEAETEERRDFYINQALRLAQRAGASADKLQEHINRFDAQIAAEKLKKK